MIIGLTGKNGSGKGTAAEYLVKKKFRYYSLSDELREVLKKKDLAATRENLIEAGKLVRQKEGLGFLANLVLKKCAGEKNVVIDSIRNPGEVRELRKKKGFVLIAIDAPVRERFERAKKRTADRDPKTFSEFLRDERKELSGKGPEQQLLPVIEEADYKIFNDGKPKKIYDALEKIIEKSKSS